MGALLHFVSRMVEVPQNMFGISSGSSFVFGIAGENINDFTQVSEEWYGDCETIKTKLS